MKLFLVILALLYVLSPYDLFPDIIPGWGWIDDLVILGLLWWYLRFRSRPAPQGRYQRPGQSFSGRSRGTGSTGKDSGKSYDFGGDSAEKDPYSVLGVEKGASPEDIKMAYKRLAHQYHPDKVNHLGQEFRDLAEKRFKEIQKAYQELTSK
jgi:DnaJ-domain-containing protein 1